MKILIENLIDQYYILAKGEKIEKVDEYVCLASGIKIRRRLLKHIVEQCLIKDSLSKQEIKEMMKKIPYTIINRQVEIVNPNQRIFPRSKILGRFNPETNKGLLVIKIDQEGFQEVLDAFYRERGRFDKLRDGITLESASQRDGGPSSVTP